MAQVEIAPNFGEWFIKLDGYDDQGYNYEKRQFWIEDEHVSSLTDKRIPFHLLKMRLPDNDTAGHKFRAELLKKLQNRFVHNEGTLYYMISYYMISSESKFPKLTIGSFNVLQFSSY